MLAAREASARWGILAAATTLAWACAGESAPPSNSAAAAAAAEESAPVAQGEGWSVRLDDETADASAFSIEDSGASVHLQTGPAGIAWHADDDVQRGEYRVSATFVQHEAPVGYREAYGLFLGGRNLEGGGRSYTYFLIRSTGEYLVKRRDGEETPVLVDWTPHDAVRGVDVEGDEPRNELAIEVGVDEVRFDVNGTTAVTLPRATVLPYGHVGVRVNHRLDLDVGDLSIEDVPPATEDGGDA